MSDEAATTGTLTPRSVGTGATVSGKSSAGNKAAHGGSDDGDGGGSGGGGSSGGKRQRGVTAGGAGASHQVQTWRCIACCMRQTPLLVPTPAAQVCTPCLPSRPFAA